MSICKFGIFTPELSELRVFIATQVQRKLWCVRHFMHLLSFKCISIATHYVLHIGIFMDYSSNGVSMQHLCKDLMQTFIFGNIVKCNQMNKVFLRLSRSFCNSLSARYVIYQSELYA